MKTPFFPGLDPLDVLCCFIAIAAVSALVFRRAFWLRITCVFLSLLGVFGGLLRLMATPRMAAGALQREGGQWSQAFRDGSLFTYDAAMTASFIFLFSAVVLAALALSPLKPRTRVNENTRDASP